MAWWFHVDAGFGKSEDLARKNASFFDSLSCLMTQHPARVSQDRLGLWWITFPIDGFSYGVESERSGFPQDKDEARAVIDSVVDRLKECRDMSFAAMDWEFEDIAEDLEDDAIEIDGYKINPALFTVAGVVVSNSCWRQLGEPENFKTLNEGFLASIDYDRLLKDFEA